MTEVLAMPEQLPSEGSLEQPLVITTPTQSKEQLRNIFQQSPTKQEIWQEPATELQLQTKQQPLQLEESSADKQPIIQSFNHELRSYKAEHTEDESDFRKSQKSSSSKAPSSAKGSNQRIIHKDYRLSSNIYNIAFGELQSVEQSMQQGITSGERAKNRNFSNQKRPATGVSPTVSNQQQMLENEIMQIKHELKSLRSRKVNNQHHQTFDQGSPVEVENIYDFCSRMTKMEPSQQPAETSGKRMRGRRHLRIKETQEIGILAKPTDLLVPLKVQTTIEKESLPSRELTFAGTDEQQGEGDIAKRAANGGHVRRKSNTIPLYNTLDYVEMPQPIKLVKNGDDTLEVSLPTMTMPRLPEMPHKDTTSKDLVQLGRKLFTLFGVCSTEEKYLLNVSKYNNCLSFVAKGLTILWYDTGRFYIGGYRMVKNEGQKHGKGIEYIPKRYLYDGEFKANKKFGFGSLRYPNGDSYEGQFYNGLKHGKGRLLQKNGIVYNGEWKNEKMDGFGVLELATGERYKGFFESGAQHGSGLIRFANGDEYKGEFVQGRFYGKGTYVWSNGQVFEGDFVNGCKHGQGSWYSRKDEPRETYIGEYKNDKKCGFGKYLWPDGSWYEGEFENDQRHGVGILTEGAKITKGEWCNGKLNRTFEPQPISARLQAYYENAKLQKKAIGRIRPDFSSSLKRTVEVKRLRTPSQSNTLSSTARGSRQPPPQTPSKPMQFYRRMGSGN